MSERLYFINNEWLTWEEIHDLGYTTLRPDIVTAYDVNCNQVFLVKDISDNTYYDSNNKTWLDDITDLDVYIPLNIVDLYYGETFTKHMSYTNSLVSGDDIFIEYNSHIVDVDSLYNMGLTLYKCSNYTVDAGNIVVWYDSTKNMYWDNRVGQKQWVSTPPTISSETDSNWTPPSNISLDFIMLDYIESEPILINQRGIFDTSYTSPLTDNGLLCVDFNNTSEIIVYPDT